MNNILFVKAKAYTLGICLLLLVTATACKNEEKTTNLSPNEQIEAFYISKLDSCIHFLEAIKNNGNKVTTYKKARRLFKNAEPILAFVDQNNYKSLNAPNILQVQEEDATDIKTTTPFGFQVIEELINEPAADSLALRNAVNITSSRLKLIKTNTRIQFKDYHIIWLIRNQIVRIATTGITGFDSSVLGQSLEESQDTYKTLIYIVQLFENQYASKTIYNNLIEAFNTAILSLNHDFDTFNRYNFIKNHTDKQLKLLVDTQNDWRVTFPFETAISNTATALFDKTTVNLYYFSDYKSDTTHIKVKEQLGKALFNDKRLSKNNNMACSSCHMKEKAFTDGKKVFNDKQIRNSPTLTYAAYQNALFMDARAGGLEGQIVGVANNHDEFNLPMDSIVVRIKKAPEYAKLLDSLYKTKNTDFNIRHAIASYVRNLNLFNSKFDNNITGKENSLTQDEINGFNLFMGKAVCATCHFPPLFNGTVPPNFSDTELEAIGVPETNDTINPVISDDLGRYNIFKTEERKHFFKTPTIRNAEKTAPYMHNGVYNTLEEVITFYNKGGGQGLGIDIEHQTLPFDELNLTKTEQAHLVAFLKTLTDRNASEDLVK